MERGYRDKASETEYILFVIKKRGLYLWFLHISQKAFSNVYILGETSVMILNIAGYPNGKILRNTLFF